MGVGDQLCQMLLDRSRGLAGPGTKCSTYSAASKSLVTLDKAAATELGRAAA